ncbi:MAG: hypothetical protein H0X63_08280 [Flavobacteriales bacterium]|nr:hypothetical protein [Flavobacteriales bacterium]
MPWLKFSLFLLLVVLASLITGCKKETLHKITYKIDFHTVPPWEYFSYFDIRLSHSKNDVPVAEISKFDIGLYEWTYEYFGAYKKDMVRFAITSEGYTFRMSIFIDDKEAAFKNYEYDENMNLQFSKGGSAVFIEDNCSDKTTCINIQLN